MIWDEQVLCDQGAKQTLPQAGDKGISSVAEPALTESLAAASLVCGSLLNGAESRITILTCAEWLKGRANLLCFKISGHFSGQ